MKDTSVRDHSIFQQIVGEQLSGVTFVMDYVQLQFNPPLGMNVYTPLTVFSHGEFVSSGDDQFRNRLCEQITKIVKSVSVLLGDAVKITFVDASVVSASLRESDYRCAEAINFYGRRNRLDVI
jgi:hypothetical protein